MGGRRNDPQKTFNLGLNIAKNTHQIKKAYLTVIVRKASQPGICMKIARPSPLSPQNAATTNLRLGTVCEFLVFDYVGAEVAKYERSMWKILVWLEKFAKVSKSLITFLLNWKKTLKFHFDFTLRVVSHGQIQPGASDHTQSDNIWLDRVMCELAFYLMCYIWQRVVLTPRQTVPVCTALYVRQLYWVSISN